MIRDGTLQLLRQNPAAYISLLEVADDATTVTALIRLALKTLLEIE
jgi:hypothetical protein